MSLREHGDIVSINTVFDIIETDTVHDLLGDAGDSAVGNLELEDGHDYLLEDGSFILLE